MLSVLVRALSARQPSAAVLCVAVAESRSADAPAFHSELANHTSRLCVPVAITDQFTSASVADPCYLCHLCSPLLRGLEPICHQPNTPSMQCVSIIMPDTPSMQCVSIIMPDTPSMQCVSSIQSVIIYGQLIEHSETSDRMLLIMTEHIDAMLTAFKSVISCSEIRMLTARVNSRSQSSLTEWNINQCCRVYTPQMAVVQGDTVLQGVYTSDGSGAG